MNKFPKYVRCKRDGVVGKTTRYGVLDENRNLIGDEVSMLTIDWTAKGHSEYIPWPNDALEEIAKEEYEISLVMES